jgi:hypothetical protein
MRRARLLAAGFFLALAKRIAGDDPPEAEDVDEAPPAGPAMTLSPEAVRMLIEGEELAEKAREERLAREKAEKAPEPPRAGSLRARAEAARRNT